MCIYKKCPEQAHLQRRKQVRGARAWERASGVLCKESGPLVGAGGLKTRTPPPCGAPTALLAGKQPKGGDGVRGSLATPHPQGRAVWAPPREGGVVGITIVWHCDLDWHVRHCKPVYEFHGLYEEKKLSQGFNFRYLPGPHQCILPWGPMGFSTPFIP